ncbi:MAG: MATE family efflux transporter [Acetatifactor sp.]
MQEKHMFTNADLKKILLPLIIEQLLNSMMGTIDTVMVSNVGSAAMSAVSLVDSINVLFIQAFSALAAGGCIICSQYIGRGDFKTANLAAKQLMLVVFGISAVITGISLIANASLLRLIFGKVEADVMEASVIYFFYTAISFPFIALYSAGAAIYRAQGNSRRPMYISIISNFINIGGNAILIWGVRMGVAGVAIATLISRAFCAIVILCYLRKPGQMITFDRYHEIRPDKNLIGKVLGLGIPSGIENSMFQFGKLMIQSTVSAMGTVAIAAQAMTNILEGLSGVAASAVGIGLMTVVGQCMGAGHREDAVYYIKKLCVVAEVIIIVSCLLVLGLTKPITILASMEPESAGLCLQMMIWITIFKPLLWVGSFTTVQGLRAAGDVKFVMVVSTVSMWICRVSLCIFLANYFAMGPMAVWIGMFVDWGVRGIFFGFRFHSRKWLNHKVIS